MSVNKILEGIEELNIKELREISSCVHERITELKRREGSDIRLSLRKGTKVVIKEENLNKKGDRLRGQIGTVKKLNPTKAVVVFKDDITEQNVNWTIPYHMLEKAV